MSRLVPDLRHKTRRLLGLELEPYDPGVTVQAEGTGMWYFACLYAWATMFAALVSCSTFLASPLLTAEIGLLLVAAFPVAYYLHYTTVSRVTMNYIVFFAAIGLAAIQFGPALIAYQQRPPEDVFLALRLLITAFLWIMAFRAFAMRTIGELVQTILPAGSIVLLSLVVVHHYTTLVGMALLIWGTLALLALERRLGAESAYAQVRGIQVSRAGRWPGTVYSWPALYVLAVIVAVGVGSYTARTELSSDRIESMRMYLARALVRHLVVPDYTPPAALWLPSIQPPEGRQVVMEVIAERPTYWRTTSYDTYSDRTWSRRMPNRRARPSLQDGSWHIPLEGSGLNAGSVATEARITPLVGFGAALPTAFFPVKLSGVTEVLFYSPDGTLAPRSHIIPGRTYSLVAQVPPTLPIGGVAHPPDPKHLDNCLQLSPKLSPRIGQLAASLSAQASSDFEKARAIELHLAYNYTYDLQVPPPWPNELVEQFLFHTKRGYCYHFATAMVIMCRTLGLPARLAVGFTQGEVRDPDQDLYLVRAEDAHAWPEVYFREGGWTAFEPTPALRDQEPRTFTDVWHDTASAVKSQVSLALRRALAQWPSITVVLVLLAAAGTVTRSYLHSRQHRPPARATPLDRILWAYRQMRWLLGTHGAPDRPELAAEEFVKALPEHLEHVRPAARHISAQYLVARFSPRKVTHTEADEVVQALQELHSRLRHKLP